MQDHFSPSLCTITKRKATELLGNIVSSASWPWLAAVLARQLCEFHTKQLGEPCSVPVGCLPHAFLQLIVCKSAVDCLKSLGWHCFCRIRGGKVPLHAPILCFLLVLIRFGCCVGLAVVQISYQTVRGALLCSCQLFTPRISAIDSLQECSQLFEELKGGAAFAG